MPPSVQAPNSIKRSSWLAFPDLLRTGMRVQALPMILAKSPRVGSDAI